jgi:hypothetical protein
MLARQSVERTDDGRQAPRKAVVVAVDGHSRKNGL